MAKLVRQLNTEHVLIDASTAPLLARMRASLSSALGRPIEDGDPELIAAASLLPYFGQGLAAADIASKSMLLQFATDEDLEAIGAHYGIARRTLHATMAVRLRALGAAAGTYAVSITGEAPDGTLFSYINDAWTTLVDAQHPEFTLTCGVAGDAYNGLDELINPVLSVTPSGETAVTDGVLTVLSASRGGGPETDDVYASRIHDTLLARTAAGSKAGYEALARTVDGVYDVYVLISDDPDVYVFISVIAPSRLAGDVQAEIEASQLLPLGLAVRVSLWPEAPRGWMAICWSTPTGGDVEGINARVNAALDAVLARFYYIYTAFIDLNLILGAVTDAGGVGAHIDAEEVYGGSFLRTNEGYMTEHTFTRTYEGVSEWI